MKFVDEVTIEVTAGKGGDGCLSFRREKNVARGGPDGGDGGDGGSVFLVASSKINTMVDYRYKRMFSAKSGESGQGRNRTGPSGADLELIVPVGTTVTDAYTGEFLGDLAKDGQQMMVARGGFHGLGNTRFKSSTNQAPRKTTLGSDGESRVLTMELRILADVGLLGLPNSGKSTFVRAVSAAKPKVADYPFTTLIPNLGVVSVESLRNFVVADIPGLISGASKGAGLGLRFLRHLMRNRVLLHIIDISEGSEDDPAIAATVAINELSLFSSTLSKRSRWLVLNKIDLVSEEQLILRREKVVKALKWEGLIYEICALSNQGTDILCQNLMSFLEEQEKRESNFPEIAEEERLEQVMMQKESRSYIDSLGCNEPLIDSSKDSLANLLSDVKRKDYS